MIKSTLNMLKQQVEGREKKIDLLLIDFRNIARPFSTTPQNNLDTVLFISKIYVFFIAGSVAVL